MLVGSPSPSQRPGSGARVVHQGLHCRHCHTHLHWQCQPLVPPKVPPLLRHCTSLQPVLSDIMAWQYFGHVTVIFTLVCGETGKAQRELQIPKANRLMWQFAILPACLLLSHSRC